MACYSKIVLHATVWVDLAICTLYCVIPRNLVKASLFFLFLLYCKITVVVFFRVILLLLFLDRLGN
jgi:hypothetical protein